MISSPNTLHLKVLMPEGIALDRTVRKVVAEGVSGSFGVLPRHIDFVEPLVPGILSALPAADEAGSELDDEVFVAIDEGLLVKCGRDVLVSVRNAAVGTELGALEQTVRDRFRRVDEREHAMRSALARLEADVVRRFMEVQ